MSKRVASLSEALDKLDANFADGHRKTTDAIKKNIDDTVQDIRTALKSPVQEYGRAIRAFTSGVDKGSRLLTAATENSCNAIGMTVQAAADKVQAQIKSASERVAVDYATLMQEVSNKIREFLVAVSRLAEGLAKIDIPTGQLSEVTECLVALNTSILAIADAIGPEGKLRLNVGQAADDIKRDSDAVGAALSDIAKRIGCVEVPPSVTLDLSKLSEVVHALETSVASLTESASDPLLQKAPQAATDAIVMLTASVHNFRQSVEKVDEAIEGFAKRDTRPAPGKGRGFVGRFSSWVRGR